MPSGYTARIPEGITFYEYALECSRAFGALISMKEEKMGVDIPDMIEPSDYHLNALLQATLELKKWLGLSPANCETEASVFYEGRIKSQQDRINDARNLKGYYTRMLKQAKAYEAPTPHHESYREFMINQIESSLDSDCCVLENDQEKIERTTGRAFRKMQIEMHLESCEYHAKNYSEELSRAEERTDWILALKNSLRPYKDCDNKVETPRANKILESQKRYNIDGTEAE